MKTIKYLFPRASKSFQDANSAIFTLLGTKNALQGTTAAKKWHAMNKTESEFALILEAMKREGEIMRYQYEGITLRWPSGDEIIRYTPDFIVFKAPYVTKFIEVKGAFTGGKFERAIERFRHAKTYWPEFTFELHQKTKNGWTQLI